MTKQDNDFELVRGSGNVFRDFGRPDADVQQTKALLAALIIRVLDEEGLSTRKAQATGALTITGVTEPVSFPISLTPSGQGVEIEGDLRLDMTTFGVEPPVVMLGLLQVRPQIRIEFKGLVTP